MKMSLTSIVLRVNLMEMNSGNIINRIAVARRKNNIAWAVALCMTVVAFIGWHRHVASVVPNDCQEWCSK